MNTDRRIAIITGVLFIVATSAALIGDSFTNPLLKSPDYLSQVSSNSGRVIAGALLTFAAAASSSGIAISLYPVLKKRSEGLAIGAVGFRLVEGVFYTVGALCLVALISVGKESAGAAGQGASYFQTAGHLLLTVRDLAGFVFGVLAFCLGAMMYFFVFYQSKLVPRWLSVWGFIAILTLLSAVLWTLFDGEPYSVSGSLVYLALPIAIQEIVMAIWLIVKGFDQAATDHVHGFTDQTAKNAKGLIN